MVKDKVGKILRVVYNRINTWSNKSRAKLNTKVPATRNTQLESIILLELVAL